VFSVFNWLKRIIKIINNNNNRRKPSSGETATRQIQKLEADGKEYREVILSNNFKVLLIHQKNASEVIGSLAIGVGGFNDPVDLPGLSHLVEQAIPLASRKYPELYGLENVVSSNGGRLESRTYAQRSYYQFNVEPDAINETLDR